MMDLLLHALCENFTSLYGFLDVGASRGVMILSNDEVRKRISLRSVNGQRY